jgi:hypothetical protein
MFFAPVVSAETESTVQAKRVAVIVFVTVTGGPTYVADKVAVAVIVIGAVRVTWVVVVKDSILN